MLANANPYSGTLPINPFAREVAAVCDKHAVPHGTPGKLADFLRALQRNKHLAMDFWSLVVRISEEERGGSVDPDWLLAVIVEGVTGRNLAALFAAGTPDQRHVSMLASMLAGEDLDNSLLEQDLPLEPNPPLEPIPLLGHDEIRRLTLKPEPPLTSVSAPTLQPLAGDSPTFRMAGYAENSSAVVISRKLVAALLLAAVAIGGVLLLHRNATGWARLELALQSKYASAVSYLKPHSETQPVISAEPRQTSSAPDPFAARNPATPVEDPALAPPATTAPFIPAPPPAPRKTAPLTSMANSTPIPPPSAPTAPLAADDPSLLAVPAQAMQQQLISSRVPIYPFTADLPGPVVIKAIVTARGTVRPIAVISGDPQLQHAALDAVATWRYRPYLVDGVPTDVTTTITLDPFGGRAP